MPIPKLGTSQLRHSTETILFADVVESVRLTWENESDFIRRWVMFLSQAKSDAVAAEGGRTIKFTGDGLCAVFPTQRSGTRSAFALHALAKDLNEGYPASSWIDLRIGLHVGDVTENDNDIFGHAVNVAARLMTLAGPAETVVSTEIRDELTADIDADIEDLGDCYLKHLDCTLRAYRLGPPGRNPVIRKGTGTLATLKPTIAVVPFARRTLEAEHRLLGDILADDTIASLSRSAMINVVSHLSTAAFRDRTTDPAQIAQMLGVTYVLSGSYRVNGAKVIVYCELADARNNQIVWADTFQDTLASILEPANDLLNRLVAGVSRAILATELARSDGRALPTLDTYTLMMSAIALMHRSLPQDFELSRQRLEAVIARAPRHSIPYAWLAKWHVMRMQQGGAGNPDAEARAARECIRRALDSDPGCSLALAIDGFVNTNLLRRLDLGEESYERAIKVNPNDSLAWLLKGTLHAFRGEGEKALEGTLHAQRLSPLDPLSYFYDSLSATSALAAHEWDLAISLAQRSLRANRTHTSTWRALAIAQVQRGMVDEARQSVRELVRVDTGFTMRKFVERSPSTGFEFGELCRRSLVEAGAPP